jgi:hypothetical protein
VLSAKWSVYWLEESFKPAVAGRAKMRHATLFLPFPMGVFSGVAYTLNAAWKTASKARNREEGTPAEASLLLV